jgi:hypothetical protein
MSRVLEPIPLLAMLRILSAGAGALPFPFGFFGAREGGLFLV